jgi:hypothetical protein
VDIYGRPTTVVRYDVHRATTPAFLPTAATTIATLVDGSVTTHTDSGAALLAGNLYYLVTATDAGGLLSGAGRELPNGIGDLRVSIPEPGMLRLAWPAVERDMEGFATIIDHYQVHRSTRPLARSALGPETLALDDWRGLSADLPAPDERLYFSVIAVDNRGNFSPF